VFFDDVLDSVKKQTPLPFEGNISFKKIETAIDDSSKTPPLSAAPNSYLQAALQEAKLKIALFISSEEAQRVFEQINKRSWDTNHFKACGVDVSIWLQGLQENISKRDEFLKQIEINKQDKKISQLISSEIT
jgi:cobalamin biosynthesis Co2+ chelatase CbiK